MNNINEVIGTSSCSKCGQTFRKSFIAKALGVQRCVISMWISGERTPNSEKVRKLCKLLSCKVRDLFPGGINR